jgi:hypothetical protein
LTVGTGAEDFHIICESVVRQVTGH